MSLLDLLKSSIVRAQTALTAQSAPAPAPPTAPAPRWERAVAVANVVVAVAAVAALVVALWQAADARQQSALSAAALAGQTRQTDLIAVGAISVGVDRPSGALTITNRSTFPLLDAALWVFGAGGDETLQEVTVPVSGVPSCREMVMPITEVLRAAEVDTNLERIEVQVTVQAPSGAWYLIADSGQAEAIEGTHSSPIDALKRSRSYQVAGDTFTGGFSSDEDHRIDFPVTAGRAVSGYSPVTAKLRQAECYGR